MIVILVLVLLSGAAVTVLNPVDEHPDGMPLGGVGEQRTPAPTADPEASAAAFELGAALRGPDFDTSAQSGYPTGDVAQSKLWFHAGIWWGALVADDTNEFRIHRLDWVEQKWIDTGVPIAQRSTVHPDVLSHEDTVWIATGGGPEGSRRVAALYRYSFDPDRESYTLDPDFPVAIADQQSHSLTLARDTQGRLWAAWINADRLIVNHTDGHDLVWADPFVPPVPGTDVATDAAVLVPYGDTVALIWTNQNLDAIFLSVPSRDDAHSWDHSEVVVEGLHQADDHVSAAVYPTDEGPRLYVVVKTSLDQMPNRNQEDPQILLLVREPAGQWTQHLVGRIRDRHTRPILLLDHDNESVYVVAASPFDGGAIYFKAASMDRISFPPGLGEPLIDMLTLRALNSPSSTKQALGSKTGMVVVASDSRVGRYAFAMGELGGRPDLDLDVPDADPIADRLLWDTFDEYPAGSALPASWEVRADGEPPFVVDDVDGRRAAVTSAAASGSAARMCKVLSSTVMDGRLTVEVEVMVSASPTSDAAITLVRHGTEQSAVVRFSDRGVFSYFDGPDHIRTEIAYTPGTWYRSLITMDMANATYDWQVRRAADDALVLSATGMALRMAVQRPADEVCVESPAFATGATFAVDRILVTR